MWPQILVLSVVVFVAVHLQTTGARRGHCHRQRKKMTNAFETKVLSKIYGPVLDNGQWRNRYNR